MTEILILAELEGGVLHSSAGELLAAGRKLGDEMGMDVSAAVLGESTDDVARDAIMLGADHVYTASHPILTEGLADGQIAALEQICSETSPLAVLTSKTQLVRSVGPRLAYRLDSGVAQDCMDVTGDSTTGRITVTRPVYGGNAMAKFTFADNNPQVVVLRVKAFEPLEPNPERSGDVKSIDITIDDSQIKSKLVETVKEESEGV